VVQNVVAVIRFCVHTTFTLHLSQLQLTANNCMYRPLTGHHQVVHPIEKGGWGA